MLELVCVHDVYVRDHICLCKCRHMCGSHTLQKSEDSIDCQSWPPDYALIQRLCSTPWQTQEERTSTEELLTPDWSIKNMWEIFLIAYWRKNAQLSMDCPMPGQEVSLDCLRKVAACEPGNTPASMLSDFWFSSYLNSCYNFPQTWAVHWRHKLNKPFSFPNCI